MLNILRSIFSTTPVSGKYPETLVKAAIERAVDGTDPWIRAVSDYKRLLRPAVVHAIDYVESLINSIAPPIEINPDSYTNDSQLHCYFISQADMQKSLFTDYNIANIRRVQEFLSQQLVALLVMEKNEKVFFGSELSGSIIVHDVPLISISFENHRLIDLAISENEVRRQLKRRAFDHLLSIALRHIIAVKAERNKLERYRTLLQSKLNLLCSGGWGFNNGISGESIDAPGIEALLAQIESDLLELGGDDNMLTNYLNVVVDVLSHPAEHLWLKKETLIRDHMGIKRREAIDGAEKTTLQVIANDEGRSFIVSLVGLSDESMS